MKTLVCIVHRPYIWMSLLTLYILNPLESCNYGLNNLQNGHENTVALISKYQQKKIDDMIYDRDYMYL